MPTVWVCNIYGRKMDKKLLVVLIFACSLATCFGQFGMGEMGSLAMMSGTGGMNGNGGGGLGGMGGGGLGGMGGGAAGIPGMGKLNSMIGMLTAMGGGGGGAALGMGSMVRMMITPMITEMISSFKMTEVVKAVLGPHAQPNGQIIKYAIDQSKPPSSFAEMLPYMNMMLELSRKIGIYMPDGTIKKPRPAIALNGTTPSLLMVAGTNGTEIGKTETKKTTTLPTIDEVRDLIFSRGILWFKSQQLPPPSGDKGVVGGGMGVGMGSGGGGMGSGDVGMGSGGGGMGVGGGGFVF